MTNSVWYTNIPAHAVSEATTYGYDKNGNILSLQENTNSSLTQSFLFSYDGNQINSLNGGTRYAYDANGNQISDAWSTKFKFNFLNLCEEISNSSPVLYMKQTYTADGVKSIMQGRYYTLNYLGSLIYSNKSGVMALDVARFGEGVIRPNGEVNYFLTDHLGSVRVIVDSNGEVREQNDYKPGGNRRLREWLKASGTNQFYFSGKEALEGHFGYGTPGEATLDFGARVLFTEIGRFYSPDPMAEKYYPVSPYAYALNNPVRYIDPDGRVPGDFFETINAAAKDWGNYYNGASILREREFSSIIYPAARNGKSGYTYTEASIGTSDKVKTNSPPKGTERAAIIHSHGNYEKGYNNNNFSDRDKSVFHEAKVDGFVATPDGSLKKYDPYTAKTSVVSTNLPSDPKDPNRKNDINPTDIPGEKRAEQEKKFELKIFEPRRESFKFNF